MTDKPMAPEDRVGVEKLTGTIGGLLWSVQIYSVGADCWAPIAGWETEDRADKAKVCLDVVLKEAYADGKRDGARAENEACEALAKETYMAEGAVYGEPQLWKLPATIAARRDTPEELKR